MQTKDIHANRATYLVGRLIAEGEHEGQDFKFTVNDPRKIARSVSAFANHSGGRLLIGVTDSGEPRGVRNEEDIYVVESAGSVYCDPPVDIEFTAYKVEHGAMIIRADIKAAAHRPVRVIEADGTRRAYYRVADENIAAHPLMVRAWTSGDRPMTLGDRHTSVLNTLRESPLTPEDLRLRVAAPRAVTDRMVIDLYNLGLIDFRYVDRHFCLYAVDNVNNPPDINV